MTKTRRTPSVKQLDPLAVQILSHLLAEFQTQKRSASDLQEGYIGMRLPALVQQCCDGDHATQVDFDLALKQLEDGKLVDTGPMVPYENPPNSSVVVLTIFSKREYIYLTEEGYRAARNSRPGFQRF
jgi:hypothetical protein